MTICIRTTHTKCKPKRLFVIIAEENYELIKEVKFLEELQVDED
jgi:hypothetical protein